MACGAGVLQGLFAFCRVPGTFRPVMEHPRLDIFQGHGPSSFLTFCLSLDLSVRDKMDTMEHSGEFLVVTERAKET